MTTVIEQHASRVGKSNTDKSTSCSWAICLFSVPRSCLMTTVNCWISSPLSSNNDFRLATNRNTQLLNVVYSSPYSSLFSCVSLEHGTAITMKHRPMFSEKMLANETLASGLCSISNVFERCIYNIYCGQKKTPITSANVDRFSKFFHLQTRQWLGNALIIKNLIPPQTCHYTTLWNFYVPKLI